MINYVNLNSIRYHYDSSVTGCTCKKLLDKERTCVRAISEAMTQNCTRLRTDFISTFKEVNQQDEVGGSNERRPLTSNFDAKKFHEVKQSALLVTTFKPQ